MIITRAQAAAIREGVREFQADLEERGGILQRDLERILDRVSEGRELGPGDAVVLRAALDVFRGISQSGRAMPRVQ